MSLVRSEQHESVVTVTLQNGTTNAISRALLEELSELMNVLKNDPDVNCIILTGNGSKFFSMGLDIPSLIDLPRNQFERFFHLLNSTCMQLYSFPRPVIAALNGHAIAGGTVLALCCDYRFIADGRTLMGLNEVKLGVPVPYPTDRMLHQIAGARNAREILETGAFFSPERSLEMGIVDAVVPKEAVLSKATEQAALLADMPSAAYRIIKQNRTEPVIGEIEARRTEKERYFVDCWYSKETRERLREAMEKF